MEQPHASCRLARKGNLAGETLPIHTKTGRPAAGDSSQPSVRYPAKQPSSVSAGATAVAAETADRLVEKISSFAPKPRRALDFTPHAAQGTAAATPATPAAAAAVPAEKDERLAQGQAVEGKRLHDAQQRQLHSVRRHLTASECTGSPQYKRRWHVQQQEQQQRLQQDSRGGEGEAHGRKQRGTQQDGVEVRMKEEELLKVEDENEIGSYRCGRGRTSDSSSKDSCGGCGVVAAAAAEVVALVARGEVGSALHHGNASSAREEAVEDTAVAAAVAAAAAAHAPAFAAAESYQGSVSVLRADACALDGASESTMQRCSGGHGAHSVHGGQGGLPHCSAKQEGEPTCSADVVVAGERAVEEEGKASRVSRGEEDKALLSPEGVEGVCNANETPGRAPALQPPPATASAAAASGSIDAAAAARPEAWEEDPVYCGMAYAGCTQQYTHKHFQRYLARMQRQKVSAGDRRLSPPTSPPHGLQPHSDWMAA